MVYAMTAGSVCPHLTKVYQLSHRTSGLAPEAFAELHNSVKRGDIVGVEGFPGKSKMGELSIFPRKFVVLSPCLHMPPTVRSGLKDQVCDVLADHFLNMILVEDLAAGNRHMGSHE